MSKLYLVISNLAGGGAQRVASTLSARFTSYYNLFIILHDGKRVDYPYKGKILDLETPASKSLLIKVLNLFVRILRLRYFKKRDKPVAVISFLEGSNIINLLSGRQGKTILSVRNYKSKQGKSFLGKLSNLAIACSYKKSDLVIAASQGIKDDLNRNFYIKKEKIAVIYNPCDIDLITKKANEPLSGGYKKLFNSPVLINIGSLSMQKGQWHLIRAFKKIKKEIPDMKLVIIGEGVLRPYFEEIIDKLNLEKEIVLTGFQNNPFAFVSRSSIFVLPSLFEGFPNVIVEALACRVPVISCDCPSGPREILAPETNYLLKTEKIEFAQYGVLVPVCTGLFHPVEEPLNREESFLAEAVINLYNDQQLYQKYSEDSQLRIRDFKVNRIVQQWLDVIEE